MIFGHRLKVFSHCHFYATVVLALTSEFEFGGCKYCNILFNSTINKTVM